MGNTEFVGYVVINENVAEVKTTTKEQYKNVVKLCNEKKKEIAENHAKELKEKAEKESKEQERKEKLAKMVAYLTYNEMVERGKFSANEKFDEMYFLWVIGKGEFNKELCPKEYLDILERLG